MVFNKLRSSRCNSITSMGRWLRAWARNQKLQGVKLHLVSCLVMEIFYKRETWAWVKRSTLTKTTKSWFESFNNTFSQLTKAYKKKTWLVFWLINNIALLSAEPSLCRRQILDSMSSYSGKITMILRGLNSRVSNRYEQAKPWLRTNIRKIIFISQSKYPNLLKLSSATWGGLPCMRSRHFELAFKLLLAN